MKIKKIKFKKDGREIRIVTDKSLSKKFVSALGNQLHLNDKNIENAELSGTIIGSRALIMNNENALTTSIKLLVESFNEPEYEYKQITFSDLFFFDKFYVILSNGDNKEFVCVPSGRKNKNGIVGKNYVSLETYESINKVIPETEFTEFRNGNGLLNLNKLPIYKKVLIN